LLGLAVNCEPALLTSATNIFSEIELNAGGIPVAEALVMISVSLTRMRS